MKARGARALRLPESEPAGSDRPLNAGSPARTPISVRTGLLAVRAPRDAGCRAVVAGRAVPRAPGESYGSASIRLQGQLRELLGLPVDLDPVHQPSVGEGLQRPDQVRQVDPVHRRAEADRLVEEDDLLSPSGANRFASRRTRFSSVPMAPLDPAGAASRALMMYSVDPT